MFESRTSEVHPHKDDNAQGSAVSPDRSEIRKAIDCLWGNRDRLELRIIHRPPPGRSKGWTEAGVFDRNHLDELIEVAAQPRNDATVCVNVNPICDAYEPPHRNKVGVVAKGLVSNNDIAGREYLLIDCDPRRKSDTSATDEQVSAAQRKAHQIETYLSAKGWPAPINGASGNGHHLLYRIALPNDEDSRKLVEGVLKQLSHQFGSEEVGIDLSVGKAGQLIKLYGTVATKGENSPSTPHRLSRILSVPESWAQVSGEKLKALLPATATKHGSALGPRPDYLPQKTSATGWQLGGGSFDLDGFLGQLGIEFKVKVKDDGTQSFELDHCPFNSEHGPGDSGISRAPDGKLGFHCFHNSCAGKDWKALRALVEAKPMLGAEADQLQVESIWSGITPQRLPEPLLSVPIFTADLLPDALAPAAFDQADRLQCPVEYLAVSMLAACGAVVGNKVGIFPKAHDESWEVYPALWGGLVGDPGTKKTPAMQAGLKPLSHLEDLATQAYAQAMQDHDQEQRLFQSRLAAWEKNKAVPKPVAPTPPKKQRLVVHDTTYQALGVILADNPRGVIALGDELSGLLQSLDAKGQDAARGFFLSGWSGTQGYSYDRVTRGHVALTRYCLSVFGGFQPDRIKTYVLATQRGSAGNDGLLQRFQLLVWPDAPSEVRLVDRAPDQGAISAYFAAVLRLRTLSTAELPSAKKSPNDSLLLHFDPEAQIIFNDWVLRNEHLLMGGELDPARQSHFSKYRSMVPALALLNHLIDGHAGHVCVECLSKASNLGELLKAHANRIYASAAGYDHEATRTLAGRLLSGDLPDGFTRRAVVMKGWSGLSTADRAQSAIDALVESGWLLGQEERGVGRPTIRYFLNPDAIPDLL